MDDRILGYMTIGDRTLNGVDDVQGRQPFGEISINQVTPPAMPGSMNTSVKYNNREIDVYFLAGELEKDIHQTYRDIVKTIRTDEKQERIIFSDDPSVCWFGTLKSVEIDQEVHRFARVICTFDCLPIAEDVEETIHSVQSLNRIEFENSGTEDSYGIVNFTLGGSLTAVTLAHNDYLSQLTLKAPSGNLNGNWSIDLKNRIVRKENAIAMNYIDQFASKWIVGKNDKLFIPKLSSSIYTLNTTNENVTKFEIKYKRSWI